MIFKTVEEFKLYNYDKGPLPIIIVDSGPAGLVSSVQFAKRGLTHLVLEQGGLEDHAEYKELKLTGNFWQNHSQYGPISRGHGFGGSLLRWSGNLYPLSASEFSESVWGFKFSDLEQHYPDVWSFFKLDYKRLPLMPPTKSDMDIRFIRKYPIGDKDFYKSYLNDFKNSKLRHLILNSPVTSLQFSGKDQTNIKVICGKISEGANGLSAKKLILAGGTLENTRLLLILQREKSLRSSLTRNLDIGENFSEHLNTLPGEIFFFEKQSLSPPSNDANSALKKDALEFESHFGKSWLTQRQTAEFQTRPRFTKLIQKFEGYDRINEVKLLQKAHSQKIIAGPIQNLMFVKQELPPQPGNRITLAESTDPVGRHLLQINLSYLDSDLRRRASEATMQFARYLSAKKIARIRFPDNLDQMFTDSYTYASHPMSSTRISQDPKHGVVNSNCQLHGVENIYVLGASVFPVTNIVNPTFTVCALALRACERIAKEI